jgi:mono/diheme cytochrome c family protein
MTRLGLVVCACAAFCLAQACAGSGGPTADNNVNTATPAPSAKPSASVPPVASSGQANFAESCAGCHKEKGEGGPVTIKGKTLNVPSLLKGHGLSHPDSDNITQITNGGHGMPAFKDQYSEAQIKELVAFIRELQKSTKAP